MKKLKQLLLILVLSLSLTSPAVIPAMGTTTVSAATVRKPSLSNSKLTIYTGKSVLLKVNGTSGKVKWISQNKRIVTVDSKGKVTARGVEYYGAAEPPVRCGESHLSGLTEPPHFVY